MIALFGWIFLWGIPALLLWSVVLSIIRMVKEPEKRQFLGRTLTFIGAIYSYTVGSLASGKIMKKIVMVQEGLL